MVNAAPVWRSIVWEFVSYHITGFTKLWESPIITSDFDSSADSNSFPFQNLSGRMPPGSWNVIDSFYFHIVSWMFQTLSFNGKRECILNDPCLAFALEYNYFRIVMISFLQNERVVHICSNKISIRKLDFYFTTLCNVTMTEEKWSRVVFRFLCQCVKEKIVKFSGVLLKLNLKLKKGKIGKAT